MKKDIFREGIPFDFLSRNRKTLMGLSILLLLIFHFSEDRSDAGYSMPYVLDLFAKYIGSGEVDVFLLLSGFGLCYSREKIRDRRTFRLHHMKKILVPYLLFCLPVIFAVRVLLMGLGIGQYIRDILFLSFITEGYQLFWYVLCILICYMIFPCVCEVLDLDDRPLARRLRLVLVTAAAFLCLAIFSLSMGKFFDRTEKLLIRIPSFMGGVYIGIRSFRRERLSREGLGWFLFLTAAAFYVRYIGSMPLTGRPALLICTLFLVLAIAFLLEKVPERLKESLPGRMGGRCLAWCGERTLELYLVHVGIRQIMKTSGISTGRYVMYFTVLALSFPVSALLHRVSGYVLKKLPD